MNKILVVSGGQRAGKTKQAIEAAYEQGYKAGWKAALKAAREESYSMGSAAIEEAVIEIVNSLRDSSV